MNETPTRTIHFLIFRPLEIGLDTQKLQLAPFSSWTHPEVTIKHTLCVKWMSKNSTCFQLPLKLLLVFQLSERRASLPNGSVVLFSPKARGKKLQTAKTLWCPVSNYAHTVTREDFAFLYTRYWIESWFSHFKKSPFPHPSIGTKVPSLCCKN